MSIARVAVNIDQDIKQRAQGILAEIGMDMTTVIDLLLRTIVREERIPFDLRTERAYRETEYRDYVNAELDKAIIEANDPNTKRLSHEEVMAHLKEQRASRKHV